MLVCEAGGGSAGCGSWLVELRAVGVVAVSGGCWLAGCGWGCECGSRAGPGDPDDTGAWPADARISLCWCC